MGPLKTKKKTESYSTGQQSQTNMPLCVVRLQRALRAAFSSGCETSLMGRSLNPKIQSNACCMDSKVMLA